MKKIIFGLLLYVISANAQETLKLLTTVHGEKQGDAYSSVAQLGDVNGDGFNDFIAGSRGKGYAKLYFGGSPFDTLNCIRFQSHEQFTAYSGSFAGDGDLNGDGYKDFVLGATYDIFQLGKIFIHFGKAKVDTLADKTITGKAPYYFFGSRMAMNGDLNGDGYDDLVVSAPNDDVDAHGRVYVFFGGKEMDTICDVFLEGKNPFDIFGGSIAIVGDTNGDGYDDLLIGASQSLAKNKPGRAYLFYGGKNIGFSNSREFVGRDSVNGSYGFKVSALGDTNRDGYQDFGISSQRYADVILGSDKVDSIKISSTFHDHEISFIGGLSDFNKDKYGDYAVVRREINIYCGGKLDTIPEFTMKFWANAIVNVGDINGDEADEIAFGIGGNWDTRGRIELYSYDDLSSIEKDQTDLFPKDFNIYQNYPNPFNPETTIEYALTKSAKVTLRIYNILGEEVKRLLEEYKQAGKHKITFDARGLPSGVYIYTISVGEKITSLKMIFSK
ncbi:MAG: T9SS type A sorting domain-containing protein [Melioribacteraceae bacterium]